MKGQNVQAWYQATERRHSLFTEVSGDTNPLHTDDDAALVVFGPRHCAGRIIHGTSIASLMGADIVKRFGDFTIAAGIERMKFSFPSYPGDEIGFEYGVAAKISTTVGDDKWPYWALRVNVDAFRRKGSVIRPIATASVMILVPTEESLAKIRAIVEQAHSSRNTPEAVSTSIGATPATTT